MGEESLTILQYGCTRAARRRGWVVALGLGLVAGILLGVGMIRPFAHIKWAIVAELGVGVVSGLVVRPLPVLAAVVGGIVTVVSCMGVVVVYQVSVGHWPITDEQTIEHYGTATAAVLRMGVILLPVVCAACAGGAALAWFVKRRAG